MALQWCVQWGALLWGLEHPPVLPDNHETNLAIGSFMV